MPTFSEEAYNKTENEATIMFMKNHIEKSKLFNDTISEPSILLHGTLAGIYPEELLYLYLTSYTLYSMYNIYDSLQTYNKYTNAYLKTTDEYQRLNLLYNDYVTAIAKLIKENSENIFDIASNYIELLYKGIFSQTYYFTYHNLSKDNDVKLNIKGSRISSGFGVCRHMAQHLKDIYQNLGYTASFVHCIPIDSKQLFKLFPNIYSTAKMLCQNGHAVVGVIEDNKSLIIDPTAKNVGTIQKNKRDIITLRDIEYRTRSANFLATKPKTMKKEDFSNYINYLDVLNTQNYFNDEDLDLLIQKNADISSSIYKNLKYYEEWNKKHFDLIYEIARLEQILSHYEDDNFTRKFKLEEIKYTRPEN